VRKPYHINNIVGITLRLLYVAFVKFHYSPNDCLNYFHYFKWRS